MGPASKLKRKVLGDNLLGPPAAAEDPAPRSIEDVTVDSERKRAFVRGGRHELGRGGEKKTKKADRTERQLLIYMSTPKLRREVDIRTAEEGVSLSAWVERLVLAELMKPMRKPRD